MKKKVVCAILLAAALELTACSIDGHSGATKSSQNTESDTAAAENSTDNDGEATKDVFAMDTYMTVTAYGQNAQEAVDKAVEEIERLDALLSTGDEDSEIARLNVYKSATLSEDGGYLVQRAIPQKICKKINMD